MLQDWVTIPAWTEEEAGYANPFQLKARVRYNYGDKEGRLGTVVSWGRSIESERHRTTQHEPVLSCEWGTKCDYLCDNEGPVVRWDDQSPADESLYWYPGQSMGVLDTVVSR